MPLCCRHEWNTSRWFGLSTANNIVGSLALFTLERPEWTVEAAARKLQLGVSTTYSYFKTLTDAGLIVAFSPGRYVLGPAIMQLDRQMRLLDPLISAAMPAMQELLHALGDRGILLLCRLYRHQIMCVHQEIAEPHRMASSYERGKLMPLHRGAASKIVLAQLPARFVQSFYNKNAADMAAVSLGNNWQEVKRSMRRLRSAGASITLAELDPGVTGVGAPLFNPAGAVIGSLAAVLLEEDLAGRTPEEVVPLVKVAATAIDAALAAALLP